MPAMASFPKMVISIHTPARGVTGVARLAAVLDANFNPHSRKGSDAHQTIALCLMQYFNPHSRKGSDRKKMTQLWNWQLFQSTLPQGE